MANTPCRFQVQDENLALADLAAACRLLDRLYHVFESFVLDGDFELQFRYVGTTIDLGVSALRPIATGFVQSFAYGSYAAGLAT